MRNKVMVTVDYEVEYIVEDDDTDHESNAREVVVESVNEFFGATGAVKHVDWDYKAVG